MQGDIKLFFTPKVLILEAILIKYFYSPSRQYLKDSVSVRITSMLHRYDISDEFKKIS